MQREKNGQKSKVYSCSAPQEFIDKLDAAARKMGWKRAELVRAVIDKHLDLVVNDKDEIPIILRVPTRLRSDPIALRAWLDAKMNYLFKKLGNVNGSS